MGQKKNWLSAGLMVALMALTGFLLLRGQPISGLAGMLRGLRPGWLLAGLGLMLAFVGCEALGTRLVLGRLGYRTPYHRCLGYSFTGFYFSSITPSASGGQPAQVYYMSRDGIPAAHGALNMMLLAICYQVAVLGYAAGVALARPSLVTDMGGGLGLLLLFGGAVNLALTAGMLCLMFLPHAAGRLAGGVLGLLTRFRLIKRPEAAREKLERQMAEYRRGAACIRRNPGLAVTLLGLAVIQLTCQFAVPALVYLAFGLSGHRLPALIGTQALLTLAVASLPLPGAVGATEGGFVRAFALFFGPALVTPAVLVSRGISFYSFLLLSAVITLIVHLRGRKTQPAELNCLKSRPPAANQIPAA